MRLKLPIWLSYGLLLSLLIPCIPSEAFGDEEPSSRVPLIFDTDMGNDIDDALALGVIHALESRAECRLLAVTTSKDNQHCAPFVDLVNTFYGRGEIPIGVVHDGKTPEDGHYLRAIVQARDGDSPRYPHDLERGQDAPEAVALLRQVLASQEDAQVVIVQVGFSTNLARLLKSKPDQHSALAGRELVAKKCRLLSLMGGMYSARDRINEYNIDTDADAARQLFADWPTEIVASGFEVGNAIKFPAESILHDFSYVEHHPLREAYEKYLKMPYDRECWDLTSVLYAVRPTRGYFELSEPGTISVDAAHITQFLPSADGRHRYLEVSKDQVTRVREALVQLASQPPTP